MLQRQLAPDTVRFAAADRTDLAWHDPDTATDPAADTAPDTATDTVGVA